MTVCEEKRMNNSNTKKVGTLTFHIAHNYGAMLQAYALPKAAQKLGYDCEIIHYCFPYIYGWGHVEHLPELCKKHGLVRGSLRYAKRLVKGAYDPRSKRNKFESFIYKTMPLSKRAYHSADELKYAEYDAILFGSDQIWNASLTDGIAKEFVGCFDTSKKTRKIAYAASCGRSEFTKEEKENYYPLLKDFYALGIREKGFCNSLCKDGFPAQKVLDPTLLLTKNEWEVLATAKKYKKSLPKKDYILVYAFDEDRSLYSFVDSLAEKYGLDVCCIAYKKTENNEKYRVYTECGVEEFLALINGATKVVTTSFHGTVFSIIFEKDFYCIPHPTLHERTDSLLSELSLEARNGFPSGVVKDIDWEKTGKLLEEKREESLSFLREAIG